MNQKGVLILGVLTLAAVAVAALSLREDAAEGSSRPAPLFPSLDESVNDVAEIAVKKGGKTITVKREGSKWALAERGGYPAKFDKVKETVVRIAGLEIDEKKTARPEQHERLGVKDPDAEGSEAAFVALRGSTGNELASLVVGKTEYVGGKQKVYVRKSGEDQVYLCEGKLDLQNEPKDWVEKEILKLENERVQGVTITHADGEEIQIGRSPTNHTQFRVENLPPGESERYEGIATPVANLFSSPALNLEDVKPVAEVDFAAEPLAKTRYLCHDGLELLVETAKVEGKTWAKISARYEAPPVPAAPETTPETPAAEPPAADDAPATPEGETPEAAAAEKPAEPPVPTKTPEELQKEADDLNARLSPWAFDVGYRGETLARHMKDLLAAPAEEPPAGAAEPGAADPLLSPVESPSGLDEEGNDAGATPTDEDGGAESPPPQDAGEQPKPDEEPRF